MREEQFHAAIGNRRLAPPHIRFGVYRNNVASALINALRVRFPVTARLLGAQDFARQAGDFALANLPASPVLIGYGGDFAKTLNAPVREVARLENLWWTAYHAAEAEGLAADALTQKSPEELADTRFTFHPSFGLMASPYNTGTVWQSGRDGQPVALEAKPQHLLVARPDADVDVRVLPASSHDFIAALAAGRTLAEAFEQSAAAHPGFDLAHELAALLSHRIIIGA
jgi:Putative DNA-binding domain